MMIQRLLVPACCAMFLLGCVPTRQVTIRTRPADALIRIDGIERGRGVVTETLEFPSATTVHRITASRLGYRDAVEVVTRETVRPELLLDLKVETRRINVLVEPVPAIVTLDGKPLSSEPVAAISADVELGVDARNNPIVRTLVAERPNFQPARRTFSRLDPDATFVLKLEPLKKNISVTTFPPGAEVFLDNQRLGVSPLKDAPVDFPVDPDTNQIIPRQLRAEKPGYDPTPIYIAWDEGKTDYLINLAVKSKQVRIITDPPGASVSIDGKEISRDRLGMTIVDLQFPPINDQGELKTYKAVISKKTADSEWYPQTIVIGWDDGKTDYRVALREVLTRPVPLLTASLQRTDQGWQVVPQWTSTLAMKDVTEGPKKTSPVQITRLAKGSQIGSLAISPDGSQILFTVLTSNSPEDFRSQMMLVKTDGQTAAEIISDGRSLDLMPSYSPGGDQIIFASNRAGRRLNIWSMSASGAPGITRLTSGDTNDLWPTIDSDPKPRLFYQAMVDTRFDPRLYMTQIGTIFQTDLTTLGGAQPRVSPKNDAVIFTAVNEQTGKRDIYRISDRGGPAENLTNSPDADETDPNWSKDGSRIVYACDRAADEEGRRNYDIWIIDLARPQQPIQITTNGSHDDCPVFDASGNSVYFRSNRGGEWAIWKIPVK